MTTVPAQSRTVWVYILPIPAAFVIVWALLKPSDVNWSDYALELAKWAGVAFGLGLGLLALLSKAHDFLDALGAMWRPIGLLILAGAVLFVDDQGRDLGVSLLSENRFWPILFLFVALLYWAANTWHSARLGLHAKAAVRAGALATAERTAQAPVGGEKPAFGDRPGAAPAAEPLAEGARGQKAQSPPVPVKTRPDAQKVDLKGDEHWLYWPPRLLGVCAHLFAAFNLSWAASHLPADAWVFSWWWLAWTAPVAVIFATVAVWGWDIIWSARNKDTDKDKASGHKKVSSGKRRFAFVVFFGSIALDVLLLLGLLVLAGGPAGFVFATWIITLSAGLFLGFVAWWRSRRWGQDDALEETYVTWGTFGFTCVVALLLWLIPIHFSRVMGSMVVIYFAFGAILAFVNFFEWGIKWLASRPFMEPRFGDWATPRALGGSAVAFLIAFGFFNARLHSFHRVRLCDGDCKAPSISGGISSPTSPADRPDVATAARTWYEQAKTRYATVHPNMPVPMVIVAAAGGGIRAAYWTAEILEKLEKDFGPDGVRPYLFAISGVSGGSVGAAAFEAAMAKRDENSGNAKVTADALATRYLSNDFLAPAIASMIFRDVPGGFLPLDIADRGVALEWSFEDASDGVLRRPFLSLFRTAGPDTGAPWWRPILLLNATHEETGNRIITSPVRIDRDVFVDAVDALNELKSDVRASTAAHNSARFLYVSPAGGLGSDHGSVIDGGYFENYGALTALEIGRAAEQALQDKGPGVRLIYLLISSDPSLDTKRTRVRIRQPKNDQDGKECLVSAAERENAGKASDPNNLSIEPSDAENSWLNEFLAPITGLTSVRAAAGNRAAAELAVEICAEVSTAQAQDPQEPTKLSYFSTLPQASRMAVWLYNTKTEYCGADCKSQSPQTRQADILNQARNIAIDQSKPFEGQPNLPYFAHLAMCKGDSDDPDQPRGSTDPPPPLQPPLGWVLSQATQEHFHELLERCGNGDQITQLEAALGRPQQQAASAAPPGH
jgi:hypothetical protein